MTNVTGAIVGIAAGTLFGILVGAFHYAVWNLMRVRRDYPHPYHPPFWRDFWDTYGPWGRRS